MKDRVLTIIISFLMWDDIEEILKVIKRLNGHISVLICFWCNLNSKSWFINKGYLKKVTKVKNFPIFAMVTRFGECTRNFFGIYYTQNSLWNWLQEILA